MKKILLFKITRDTHLWKKGQKVWELWGTGALAAKVIGKYKGNGRWIKGWVHWPDPEDGLGFNCKPDCKWIDEVEVSDDFYNYIEFLSGTPRSSLSSSE